MDFKHDHRETNGWIIEGAVVTGLFDYKQAPLELLEQVVDRYGIEVLDEFVKEWGESPDIHPSIIFGSSSLTIFDNTVEGLPRSYKRAKFAHTKLKPQSAYSGAKNKAVIVFSADIEAVRHALPISAKRWGGLGVELTAAEFGKAISIKDYERMTNFLEYFLNELEATSQSKEEDLIELERDISFGSW